MSMRSQWRFRHRQQKAPEHLGGWKTGGTFVSRDDASMRTPNTKKPSAAYAQIADEFDIPEFAVREICGPVGREAGISFEDRLQVLRVKLSDYGLTPVREPYHDPDAGEQRELRSCLLCESFLENDDEGTTARHEEGALPDAVICRNCIEPKVRM